MSPGVVTGPRVPYWDLRSEDFDRNQERDNSHETCLLCGRKVSPKTAVEIEVSIRGSLIPEGDPASNGPESQGCFFVGSTCRRLIQRMRLVSEEES